MYLQVKWTNGEEATRKFQLVGDNWDKDILPSYRTTNRKTESLHLPLLTDTPLVVQKGQVDLKIT